MYCFSQALFQTKLFEDWEDCGELGDDTQRYRRTDSSCLWGCEWKNNPYYKRWFPWTLDIPYQASKCNIIQDVIYYITAPRIPIDLMCLENCFNSSLVQECIKEDRFPVACTSNFSYWIPSYQIQDKNLIV